MNRLPFSADPRAAAAALVLVATAAPAQVADPARAPVEALDNGLIAIMKGGKKLGATGRAAQIAPVVDRAFDLPYMTRLAVGPLWVQATPAERTALIAAFRKLTISEYARNFADWSGQAFAIDPKVDARGTDRLIKTTLTAPREAPVSIAYRVRMVGTEWKITDVFFKNAISQLTTRRADFATVLGRGGPAALIEHINTLAEKR
ncbi:MAG: ABC transporter substrate-binding protein [Sphingomonas sp.]|uniref:ABC transporter substrate-binding protein n=1 Tax=Sphingomonas sp. TaxID=28214 RepID=UPI0017A8D1B7|nr:ABC transporter substrate-binding protein [Sphingomonas sp.]